MRERHAILPILLPFLLLLPIAPRGSLAAPREAAPRTTRLDLEGVPRLAVRPSESTFEPRGIRVPGKKPGWVVRIETEIPPGTDPGRREESNPTPAVRYGRVFLGGGFHSRKLFALDAKTGRRLWTVPLADNGPSAPVTTTDRVITNTESCTTYAVHTVTGKVEWSRRLGPTLDSPPAVSGRRLLTGLRKEDGGWAFAALDVLTGDPLWETPLPRETVGAPVVALDRVFVTLATREGVCLDLRTGERLWSTDLLATSAPWMAGGGLYFAAIVRNRPEIVRVDPLTGKIHWRAHMDRVEPESRGDETTTAARTHLGSRGGWGDDPPRPVVLEPFVILGAGRQISIWDSETGDPVRRLVLPEGRTIYAPPAVLGGRLLFATADGLLLEVDPEVFAVRRAMDLGVPVFAQPVVADGRVFVTSRDLVIGVPWGN